MLGTRFVLMHFIYKPQHIVLGGGVSIVNILACFSFCLPLNPSIHKHIEDIGAVRKVEKQWDVIQSELVHRLCAWKISVVVPWVRETNNLFYLSLQLRKDWLHTEVAMLKTILVWLIIVTKQGVQTLEEYCTVPVGLSIAYPRLNLGSL